MTDVLATQLIRKYKETVIVMIHYAMPGIPIGEIVNAIDYSILKRINDPNCKVINNYKKTETNITLLELSEYIMSREPIITASGVMFKKHADSDNPLGKMMEIFMNSRDELKKEMFKHPKGSDEFEKYNLLQLLTKIDTNGIYGALGQYSCMFYNIYVASSITAQGRSCISAAGLQFEMFLANNVKYSTVDELVTFIYNILNEKPTRHFDDFDILNHYPSLSETFYHIISMCGFIPSVDDYDLILKILKHLDQSELNRIYYKNNLYEFMENQYMTNLIIDIMTRLKVPYINPYKVPVDIKEDIDYLSSLFMEYVYYSHAIIDKVDKFKNMIKSVIIIQDTDSCIISLDAWYRYVLSKIENIDIPIKRVAINPIEYIDGEVLDSMEDEDGNFYIKPIEYLETEYDYDFYNDERIEKERIINPIKIIPQDGIRYSIINIMACCLTQIINDYMIKTTKGYHSYAEGKKCLLIMKNEFLFKRALVLDVKKNYATLQELQEGNIVPINKQLDIKGMSIDKSGLNSKTRKKLKSILYEDILRADNIDQLRVIKDLSLMEKDIYESLSNGSKDYYKPANIKSLSTYDDPMRIQGIKGSVIWNMIRGTSQAIDLEKRNSVMIVKVDINPSNIEELKNTHIDIYDALYNFMKEQGQRKCKTPSKKEVFDPISAISIPMDTPTPKWLLEYIDYGTIINDNLTNFPLECIGIHKGSNNVNYTNILKL